MYDGAACDFGLGTTFLEKFGLDEHADIRQENFYYPFASKQDWEVGSWLQRSSLSMAAIDSLLSLELVRQFILEAC
jgi:hypothetical protein